MLVGFGGGVLIANPDPSNLAASVGVGFVLASAVAWTAGAVVTTEDDAELGGLALQAWMLLVGALALDVVAFVVPGQSFAAAAFPPETIGWVLYFAVVPGAAGFLVYFTLLDRLGRIEMGAHRVRHPAVRRRLRAARPRRRVGGLDSRGVPRRARRLLPREGEHTQTLPPGVAGCVRTVECRNGYAAADSQRRI